MQIDYIFGVKAYDKEGHSCCRNIFSSKEECIEEAKDILFDRYPHVFVTEISYDKNGVICEWVIWHKGLPKDIEIHVPFSGIIK